MTGAKECPTCHTQFVVTPEDETLLRQVGVDEPIECTPCVWRRLLSFFVFGRFRKTTSALSGKPIITNFPESTRFPLYERGEWVSDAWDPMEYGVEYDSARPFLDQLEGLVGRVPHPHQSGIKNTDSEWCDDVWNSKNCYLCRSLLDCEDVSYAYRTFACKNSIDLAFCFKSEASYDSLYCFNCYQVRYCFNAHDSMDSAFLYDCRNVQDCFMCWNLRNTQHCIRNVQYSKDEYEKKRAEFDTASFAGVAHLKEEFWRHVAEDAVHRLNYNLKTVTSTGNFLSECKGCTNCYFLDKSENCRHVFRGFTDTDTIHAVASMCEKCALSSLDAYIYETVATSHCTSCRYSAYLDYCEECEYCFGCVGLRKKQYCILNKQYSKEEYAATIERMKADMRTRGEWGAFFPYGAGYCGYNFTVAHWYFPETKEGAERFGGRWEEQNDADALGMSEHEIPDRIDDVPDDLPAQPIRCPKSGWRFNIAPRELEFYRKYRIPVPHHHFDVRTLERFKPFTVFREQSGSCCFCGKGIVHFYPPEWKYRKIACLECYQEKIA